MKRAIIIFLFLLLILFLVFILKCKKEKFIIPLKEKIPEKEKIAEKISEPQKIIKKVKNVNYDAFLMKIDADGNCLWTKTFDTATDWIDFVIQTKDNGFIAVGRNISKEEEIDNLFLLKTDESGNTEWVKNLFSDSDFKTLSEIELKDGYLLMGKTYNTNKSKSGIYITKINKDGNYDWVKTFGKEFYEWGYWTYNTYDGAAMIIGLSEEVRDIKADVYLTKKSKEYEKSKIYGGSDYDWAYNLSRVKNGFLLTGITFSYGNGLSDIYIINVDSEGNSIFTKTIGEKGFDDGYYGIEAHNGGFIICGATNSSGNEGYDIYIIKTDKEGNTLWTKAYGSQFDDAAYCIAEADNDCYIIGGIIGKTLMKQ